MALVKASVSGARIAEAADSAILSVVALEENSLLSTSRVDESNWGSRVWAMVSRTRAGIGCIACATLR